MPAFVPAIRADTISIISVRISKIGTSGQNLISNLHSIPLSRLNVMLSTNHYFIAVDN